MQLMLYLIHAVYTISFDKLTAALFLPSHFVFQPFMSHICVYVGDLARACNENSTHSWANVLRSCQEKKGL